MLEGDRPDECNYCWKVEDTPGEHFSDRSIKSSDDWAQSRFDEVATQPWDKNINPSYMEVMFSSKCTLTALIAPHIYQRPSCKT